MTISSSPRRDTRIAVIFVSIAILLGGQSVYPTFLDALVQSAAIAVLAWIFVTQDRDAPRASRTALLAVAAILAVPLLQLVPLPYGVWAALPAHDWAAEALTAAQIAPRWRPLKLDPSATRLALLQLLPAIGAFFLIARLDRDGQRHVAIAIGALGVVSLVLGALQAAGGVGSVLYPYPTRHEGLSVGFFANRNHQADLGIIAALMLAAIASRRRFARSFQATATLVGVALLFFLVSIVATQSRTGFALFVAVLPVIIWMLRHQLPLTNRAKLAFAAAALAVTVAIVLTGTFQTLAQRFVGGADLRTVFWPDVIYLIGQYFPYGSGLGTFDVTYRAIESLASVTDYYVNAAHNDYLQLAAEAGLLALVPFAIFCVWFGRAGFYALRAAGSPLGLAALIAIALLLLHSLVDYPLRTIALSVVLGAACAILDTVRVGADAEQSRVRY